MKPNFAKEILIKDEVARKNSFFKEKIMNAINESGNLNIEVNDLKKNENLNTIIKNNTVENNKVENCTTEKITLPSIIIKTFTDFCAYSLNSNLPPIRLINFKDFCALNSMPRYPENKDIVIDVDINSIDRENSLIVFISHCWMSGWYGAKDWNYFKQRLNI